MLHTSNVIVLKSRACVPILSRLLVSTSIASWPPAQTPYKSEHMAAYHRKMYVGSASHLLRAFSETVPSQSAKAAAALKKWKEGQKSEDDKAQLFEDATDDYILQVNLRKMPEKKRLKPVMLYVQFPHSPCLHLCTSPAAAH